MFAMWCDELLRNLPWSLFFNNNNNNSLLLIFAIFAPYNIK